MHVPKPNEREIIFTRDSDPRRIEADISIFEENSQKSKDWKNQYTKWVYDINYMLQELGVQVLKIFKKKLRKIYIKKKEKEKGKFSEKSKKKVRKYRKI